MTKFIFVRHGEPTYDEVEKLGFIGSGLDLAPLTDKGIMEVKETAKNKIFENSDILIASPYTRTMQTASIIASKWGLDINVELLLHEWLPDMTYTYKESEKFRENLKIAREEWENYQNDPSFKFSDKYETLENVRKRGLSVLEKYCDYDKVIVVAHLIFISMFFKDKIKLKTGEFIVTTSEELEKNFDFHPKKLKKH